MADSVDACLGTSDEYLDPHCEPCFDTKGRSTKVYGYCNDCYQYMCHDCHALHGKFQYAKDHVIVRGSKMPQSIADKPPKYERCETHATLKKEMFCCDHKVLVCQTCTNSDHTNCAVKSINATCKTIPFSELDKLYDAIQSLEDKAQSVQSAVEANIVDLEVNGTDLLEEIKVFHETIINKIQKAYQETQRKIVTQYQSEKQVLSEYKDTIDDIIVRIQAPLKDARRLKGKPMDTKSFLKIQEHVGDINRITGDLRNLGQSRHIISLSFDPSIALREMIATTITLGSVEKVESKPDHFDVNEVIFPHTICQNSQTPQTAAVDQNASSSSVLSNMSTFRRRASARNAPVQTNMSQTTDVNQSKLPESNKPTLSNQSNVNAEVGISATKSEQLSVIKATKINSFDVKQNDDEDRCWITGIAITNDKRTFLVDRSNKKVKVFSKDMKFLSSVSLVHRPWDIAVITDQELVMTNDNKELVILNMSRGFFAALFGTQHQLSIKSRWKLEYGVHGITNYKDKFIVACPDTELSSVKLIDQTGKIYWSVSTDQQGRQLFQWPLYVQYHKTGTNPSVVVTDRQKNTVTVLKTDAGDIVTTHQLEGFKWPRGVTTVKAGKICVCYSGTDEVATLTDDLTETRIILTRTDSTADFPYAIMYDDATNQLLVSYHYVDRIDCFKLC